MVYRRKNAAYSLGMLVVILAVNTAGAQPADDSGEKPFQPDFARVRVLTVDPSVTDPGIQMVHGPHIAVYDTQVRSRHALVLMIVGTGASAGSFKMSGSICLLRNKSNDE